MDLHQVRFVLDYCAKGSADCFRCPQFLEYYANTATFETDEEFEQSMFKVWNLTPQANNGGNFTPPHAVLHMGLKSIYNHIFFAIVGTQPLSMTQTARAREANILLSRLRAILAQRGAR